MAKRRRNDAPWRLECIQRRGAFCRACGATNHLEVDHLMPKSQGGLSVVENGLVLCGSFANGCHPAKTDSRLTIDRRWLDDDQILWLAEVGWVTWTDEGEAVGRGMRHFADVA